MPKVTEFTIHVEDRPGTLGKLGRALAERGVNIVAFQAFPGEQGKSILRLVTDNPNTTKNVLDSQRTNLTQTSHTETQVAQIKLPHKPGSLAKAAARLGEANININYAYSGLEPGTNAPVIYFGVENVGQASKLLDESVAAAA